MTMRAYGMKGLLAAGTVLFGLGGGAVHAADVTPDQKAALEALLRSWYAAGGKALVASANAMRVVAAGDHLDVSAPIILTGPIRGEVRLTGRALPRDDGRWRFEEVRTATPFAIVADVPVPPKEGVKNPAATAPVTYNVTIADQNTNGDYDPAFRTPTRYQSSFKGITVAAAGEGVAQRTVMESGNSVTAITPVGPDAAKLDFETKGEGNGYAMSTRMGRPEDGAPEIGIAIGRVAVTAGLHGLDRAQGGKLIQAVAAIGELPNGGKGKPIPPALREMLATALRGLASDLSVAEDFEQLKVSVAGMVFAFDKGRLTMGGTSRDGLVRAAMELGYDGLAMPDMGMGFEELIPRRVALRPYLANMSADGFGQLLSTAATGKDPAPGDFAPLFGRGPVTAGIEALALDIAGTVFTGEGAYTMTSPTAGSGKARLVAENLDGLIQKLNGQPMAQQAVPAIVFLKGIGKADGSRLVWDVDYTGNKVLVNGLDMTALAGGSPKGPPPRR